MTHDNATLSAASAGSPVVAALFVQPDGCYSKLPAVDAWPESRDARKYNGPLPVVAHPPCSRWSRLARFCEVRHGLKVGDDGGCFESALRSVRTFGGVIEHPAFSKAWARFGLPRPDTKHQGWTQGACGGFSCYVEQGRYGHPVKKATWLYVFGVPAEKLPELRWGHTPDSRGVISRNQDWRGGMDKWRDSTGHRAANATPPEFRDELIRIARMARVANMIGQWIPVGERLPDKSDPVLLWCSPKDDEDTWLTYCDIGRYSRTSNGNHWFDTDDGGAVPTHWMPLPAPPTDAK